MMDIKRRFIVCLVIIFGSVDLSKASVSFTQSTYGATIGSPVTLTCLTNSLTKNEITWRVYDASNTPTVIWAVGAYFSTSASSSYNVTITNSTSASNFTTELTILSVVSSDLNNTYECYSLTTSSLTATAKLFLITTTTVTTTTVTIAPTTVFKISNTCLGESYNSVQYVFILLTFLVLIVTCYILHFTFQGNFAETFTLVIVTLLSLATIIIMIIFWINPNLISSGGNVVAASMGLIACIMIWVMVLQYAVRLNLAEQISTGVIIFIAIDAGLQLPCLLMVFVSNLYCASLIVLPTLSDFSYSYLEIIGASLMFLFSLFVLAIVVTMYTIKKQKIESANTEVFKSLRTLTGTGPLSPSYIPFSGPFNSPSTVSFGNEPVPSRIQELWFPPKTKHSEGTTDLNITDGSLNQSTDKFPQKPKKLTPVFSKKGSEVNKVIETDAVIESSNQTAQVHDLSKTEATSADDVKGAKVKKTKKGENIEVVNLDDASGLDTNRSTDNKPGKVKRTLSNLGGRKAKDEPIADAVKQEEPAKPADEPVGATGTGEQNQESKPPQAYFYQSNLKGKGTKKKKEAGSEETPSAAAGEADGGAKAKKTKAKKAATPDQSVILVDEASADPATANSGAESPKKTKKDGSAKPKKTGTKKGKLTDIESSVESFI